MAIKAPTMDIVDRKGYFGWRKMSEGGEKKDRR